MPPSEVYQPRNLQYLEEAELRINDMFRGTGFELYGIVTWVNTLGDSRAVKLLVATNQYGGAFGKPRITEITGDVARILGLKVNHGGVIVGGGGVDPLEQIKHALLYKIGVDIKIVTGSAAV